MENLKLIIGNIITKIEDVDKYILFYLIILFFLIIKMNINSA